MISLWLNLFFWFFDFIGCIGCWSSCIIIIIININIIYIITSGAALEESQILVTLVYKQAFEYFRYGYAAALSVIIFFILLVFSGVFTKYQKLEE